MNNFRIRNSRLESAVLSIANDFIKNYNIPRCYEIVRHLQKELPKKGFSEPEIKDGLVAYSLDFLTEACSSSEIKKILSNNRKEFSHLLVDHSWCELPKEETRIDYLPSIKLPEGKFDFNELFLSRTQTQSNELEYLPIGREFGIGKLKFIYTPLAGPEIGRLILPKIIRLRNL